MTGTDKPGYLLIAGAARSGTTLMMRLLDGHPQLLVLPMEASLSQRWVPKRDLPQDDLERYFATDFIDDRSAGQQTVMASTRLLEAYNERIVKEFGVPFDLDLDHDAFRSAYADSFGREGALPGRVARSLMEAYIAGKGIGRDVVSSYRHFVIKEPFYTEAFAQTMAEDLPEAKFLHIVRDPFARYASSKTRRIHYGGGACARVNRLPFPIGIAELSVGSLHMGLENLEKIGPDRYRMVTFRDVVEDPERTMGGIAEWLGIEKRPDLYRPTVQGEARVSMSSFSNRDGLDPSTVRRMSKYRGLTSSAERHVHNYLIAKSAYRDMFDIPPGSLASYRAQWLLPFRHERFKDYVWRLGTLKGFFLSGPGWEGRFGFRLRDLALRQGFVDKM